MAPNYKPISSRYLVVDELFADYLRSWSPVLDVRKILWAYYGTTEVYVQTLRRLEL